MIECSESGVKFFNSEGVEASAEEAKEMREAALTPGVRVRKLTQLEAWRLMGFEDQDFYKAQAAMNENLYGGNDRSGSQLYKQAGNSIVVDVLCAIMGELYQAMPYLFEDMVVGSFFSGIGAFEKSLTRLVHEVNSSRDSMDIKKCEICGSGNRVKHNQLTNMFLCERHCKQIYKYGEITNPTPYNKNEGNEIRSEDSYAVLVLRNRSGEVVAESVIDLDEIETVRQYKWNYGSHGYVSSGSGKDQVLLHRLLSHAPEDVYVDHCDRNKLNNRKSNFRFCTAQENNRNKGLLKNNTSGVTGVTFDRARNQWIAQIVVDEKNIHLGRFDVFDDAVRARLDAERMYFKEFSPYCTTASNSNTLKSCIESGELRQIGYINNYNGDANRIYDGSTVARALKAEAGGGGAKTGWYAMRQSEADNGNSQNQAGD